MAGRGFGLSRFVVLFLFLVFVDSVAVDRVVYVNAVVRHGDRAPYEFPLLNDSYSSAFSWKWPYPPQALTPLGMNQEFLKGSLLREEFVTSQKFLSAGYNESELYVRSTDYPRTLQSAQSLLMGLYPPSTGPSFVGANGSEPALPYFIQPIPIHTVSREEENELYAMTNCPKYHQWRENVAYQSQTFKDKEESESDFIAQIQELTGAMFKVTLADWEMVYDPIFCEFSHNISAIPGLSQEIVDHVIELERFWRLTVFPNDPEVGKWTISPFFSRLRKDLDYFVDSGSSSSSSSNSEEFYQFRLNVAHDYTVFCILGALNIGNRSCSYASHLLISLMERVNGSRYVQMSYDGEVLSIPNCGKECDFYEFEKLLAAATSDDWKAGCALDVVEDKSKISHLRSIAWFLGFGAILISGIFFTFVILVRRQVLKHKVCCLCFLLGSHALQKKKGALQYDRLTEEINS